MANHMLRDPSTGRFAAPVVVRLDNGNGERRDGQVVAIVEGPGALAWAKDDRTIDGSTWEGVDGPDYAYTILMDRETLSSELEADGYRLDLSEYEHVPMTRHEPCDGEGCEGCYIGYVPKEG